MKLLPSQHTCSENQNTAVMKGFPTSLGELMQLCTSKSSPGPAPVLNAPGMCGEGLTGPLRLGIPSSPSSALGRPLDTDRAEELRGLLQEAHQAALSEVSARAHPILIG